MKVNITKDTILKAIEGRADSLTTVWRQCGGKGSVAGSTATKMRSLVPDLDVKLAANRKTKTKTRPSPAKVSISGERHPRHPQNPFRPESSYGRILDLLTDPQHLRDGILRDHLIELAAKANRKSKKLAAFDVAVVLSPKGESPTSPRHRSCRAGYGVVKEGDRVRVIIPPPA